MSDMPIHIVLDRLEAGSIPVDSASMLVGVPFASKILDLASLPEHERMSEISKIPVRKRICLANAMGDADERGELLSRVLRWGVLLRSVEEMRTAGERLFEKLLEKDRDGRFIAGVLASTGGYGVRAAEIERCVDALADCNGDFLDLEGKRHGELVAPYLALCIAGRIASGDPAKLNGAVKLAKTVDLKESQDGFRFFFQLSPEWGKEKEDILRKTEFGVNRFLSKFGDGECSAGDMCALFSLVEKMGKTGWPEETMSAYLESISGALAGKCGDDPEAEVVPVL